MCTYTDDTRYAQEWTWGFLFNIEVRETCVNFNSIIFSVSLLIPDYSLTLVCYMHHWVSQPYVEAATGNLAGGSDA